MKTSLIVICVLVLIGCAYTSEYEIPREKIREIAIASSQLPEKIYEIRVPAPSHTEPVAGSAPPRPTTVPSKPKEHITELNTTIVVPGTRSITEKIESFTQKLFSAKLAFVMKDKANINDDIKAQLLIDPREEVKNLENQLTVEGTAIVKTIKVSKIVKATLTAPDFHITKITEEEQILSDTEPTEWLWKLNAKSSGKHEINLSVTAIVKVDGRESKHHLKTFDKTVIVEITGNQLIMDWLETNYKWIISTLIIPVFVFLFKEKFKKLLEKKSN